MKTLPEIRHAAKLLADMVALPMDRLTGLSEREILATKLDLLTDVLDAVRGATGTLRGSVRSPERFALAFVDPGDGRLVFARDAAAIEARGILRTNDIIPWLLNFLYMEEYAGLPVHEILRGFTAWMAPFLSPHDYATGTTGRMRFHTAASFAASRMRKSGLLLDTRMERFRTWRLSLGGILAGREIKHALWDNGEEPWREPIWKLSPPFGWLHSRWLGKRMAVNAAVAAVLDHPAVIEAGIYFLSDGAELVLDLRAAVGAAPGSGNASLGAFREAFLRLAEDDTAVRVAHLWAGRDLA